MVGRPVGRREVLCIGAEEESAGRLALKGPEYCVTHRRSASMSAVAINLQSVELVGRVTAQIVVPADESEANFNPCVIRDL